MVRMQEVKISETGIIELDIMKLPITCIIIISEGKVKISELPSHGELNIVTHQGKVKRTKREEGEEF